jgi:hypothetical protein
MYTSNPFHCLEIFPATQGSKGVDPQNVGNLPFQIFFRAATPRPPPPPHHLQKGFDLPV